MTCITTCAVTSKGQRSRLERDVVSLTRILAHNWTKKSHIPVPAATWGIKIKRCDDIFYGFFILNFLPSLRWIENRSTLAKVITARRYA